MTKDHTGTIQLWLAAVGVLTVLVLAKGIAGEFMLSGQMNRLMDQALVDAKEARDAAEEARAALAEIQAQRAEATDQLASLQGYSQVEILDREGSLLQGEQAELNVSLEAGIDYLFVVACDEDCLDVDLGLRDEFGDTVVADTLTDALPVIRYAPSQDDNYTLLVDMVECTIEPCGWQLHAYSQHSDS